MLMCSSVRFTCVFTAVSSEGLGAWSGHGCSKKAKVQNGEVVCSCQHLTTFAVLQVGRHMVSTCTPCMHTSVANISY